jgi:hypothetical protein
MKRRNFKCGDCGEPASKTIPNFHKQFKRLGRSLCSDCAKNAGKDKIRDINNKKYPIKSNTITEIICQCGLKRTVQERQRRINTKCRSCAAKLSRVANNHSYIKASNTRTNNDSFKKAVLLGILSIPEAVRSNRSRQALTTRWKDKTIRFNEFIRRAEEIHKHKYNYSLAEYYNVLMPITIICPDHGKFQQSPRSHLISTGCRRCFELRTTSSWHNQVYQFINQLVPESIKNSRDVIHPHEIDIWIPHLKIGIECHGVYWHSCDINSTKSDRMLHNTKADKAATAGIQLLQFFETEWLQKQSIVQSIIRSKLHLTTRIFARKCSIQIMTQKDFNIFMNNNHLQGTRNVSIAIGLKHNDTIVAMIGISRHQKYEHELIRYASLLGTTVVGGLSKLLATAKKEFNIKTIMTYADRRYSNSMSYKKVGFRLLKITKPNYYYTTGCKTEVLYSRQKFQKHKLNKLLDSYDPAATESKNMFDNGYRQLWDAGHYKLILENSNIK